MTWQPKLLIKSQAMVWEKGQKLAVTKSDFKPSIYYLSFGRTTSVVGPLLWEALKSTPKNAA